VRQARLLETSRQEHDLRGEGRLRHGLLGPKLWESERTATSGRELFDQIEEIQECRTPLSVGGPGPVEEVTSQAVGTFGQSRPQQTNQPGAGRPPRGQFVQQHARRCVSARLNDGDSKTTGRSAQCADVDAACGAGSRLLEDPVVEDLEAHQGPRPRASGVVYRFAYLVPVVTFVNQVSHSGQFTH
jgi:hypothetical protein